MHVLDEVGFDEIDCFYPSASAINNTVATQNFAWHHILRET